MFNRQLTRAVWHMFHADNHSRADFIAILDPDVVFFSPYIPELLFDWSEPIPRPVQFGLVAPVFVTGVISLGFDWVAEFMYAFPMLVRPTHLRGLRRYMVRYTGAQNFEEAFQKMMQLLTVHIYKLGWAGEVNTVPSFTSILGHWLWHQHRKDYFWSIRDGLYSGIPSVHTCPSLRVAAHYGNDRSGQKGMRLGTRRQALEYRANAARLMLAGELGFSAPGPERDLLASELTAGGWGQWTDNSSRHCKHRNIKSLLETYSAWDLARHAAQQA